MVTVINCDISSYFYTQRLVYLFYFDHILWLHISPLWEFHSVGTLGYVQHREAEKSWRSTELSPGAQLSFLWWDHSLTSGHVNLNSHTCALKSRRSSFFISLSVSSCRHFSKGKRKYLNLISFNFSQKFIYFICIHNNNSISKNNGNQIWMS